MESLIGNWRVVLGEHRIVDDGVGYTLRHAPHHVIKPAAPKTIADAQEGLREAWRKYKETLRSLQP